MHYKLDDWIPEENIFPSFSWGKFLHSDRFISPINCYYLFHNCYWESRRGNRKCAALGNTPEFWCTGQFVHGSIFMLWPPLTWKSCENKNIEDNSDMFVDVWVCEFQPDTCSWNKEMEFSILTESWLSYFGIYQNNLWCGF